MIELIDRIDVSETYNVNGEGYGACWNKALLLAAILQNNQIPAQMAYNQGQTRLYETDLGGIV